jgi:SpoVK/Ycf46/Vps4 family AAA+-type ATPase
MFWMVRFKRKTPCILRPQIRRPGRFASVIEVGFPTAEARAAYLETKISDKSIINRIVSKTDGFSIDELKEVVRGHFCMMKPLDQYIDSIKSSSSKSKKEAYSDDDDYDSWQGDEESVDQLTSALRKYVGRRRGR